MKISSAEIASQASRQYECDFSFEANKRTVADSSGEVPVFGDTLSAFLGDNATGIGGGTDVFAELWDSTIGRTDQAGADGLFSCAGSNPFVSQKQRNLLEAIVRLLQERFGLQWGESSAAAAGEKSAAADLSGLYADGYSLRPRFALEIESGSYEYEKTSFSSSGKVLTADGKEYSFNVTLEMERMRSEYIKKAVYLDPLVINYAGTAAQLETEYFSFDLNADGELDQLARLGDGSGFLAYDRNGDGFINDGTELFGAASGDGFADLAEYDADGNGWIDENDEIFVRLGIWTRGENGEQVLYGLKEKDIGAICLGRENTEFALARNGESLGVIRQTGVALTETGQAVTVQQIDLSLRARNQAPATETGEVYNLKQAQSA